jgi:hypothetical protein
MSKTNDELDQSIRHLGALIETVIDQNNTILESLDTRISAQMQPVVEKLDNIEADVKTIRNAVTATNDDLQLLDRRVGSLESNL